MLDDLLKTLVEFKTITNDTHENEKALLWIKNEISNLPVFTTLFKSNNHSALLITTRKTKTPKIWLNGHVDVVAGSDKMFAPKIIGNKLIGRGVFDMKFAVASYIFLLKDINKNLKQYDFGIMLVSDEEIGGFNGTSKILESGYSSKLAIIPDGGENWTIEESAKGAISIVVKSKGISAHGARVWLGKNAINNLTDFLLDLRNEFNNEPCNDPKHYHTTLNIGKISGGNATNQVPNYAEAGIDIRFTPDTNFKEVFKRIKNIKRKFKNIDIEIKTKGVSYKIDKSDKFLKSFLEILSKNKIKTGFINSHGSSDARFFVEKNIPVILTRPKGGNLHSEKEWIDIKSLNLFYKVLKEFIEKEGKR